jgi:hypothetical protein
MCGQINRRISELENTLSKTRAIRFSTKEDQQIDAFLKANPIFDFSTLAKTAIMQFLAKPQITLKAVKSVRKSKKGDSNVTL